MPARAAAHVEQESPVQLNFGLWAAFFNGEARYLEGRVKLAAGSTVATLSPRQQTIRRMT